MSDQTNIPDPNNTDNRTIAYGVEQPGVYDGVLYWVDTNGYAFHRWTDTHMKSRAQPFIDAHNAGRYFLENPDKWWETDKTSS